MFVNFIIIILLVFSVLISILLNSIFIKNWFFKNKECIFIFLFIIWIFFLVQKSLDNVLSVGYIQYDKTIFCEEKKKLWFFTHKFGILKYLIADKNEVGGVLFNVVNKNINQVVIPTGNLTGKNGCDSVLYNILNNQMSSIQYKNKMTDYSLLSEKEFHSKIKTIFRDLYYCDQLVIDTSESNVKLLDHKMSKNYPKFYHLISDKKIVFLTQMIF